MKISKGLATWAGVIAAVGQYLGAIAIYLTAADPTTAVEPLKTATITLLVVIAGRMGQAIGLAVKTPKPAAVPSVQFGSTAATSGTTANVTWSTGGPAPATKPGEFEGEPESPPEDELRDLHENDLT